VDDLPQFRYHPDPLATGAIQPSEDSCSCCGRHRGHLYQGPVFSAARVDGLCPWCIADGSAATLFEAEFTDAINVPDDVPPQVLTELLTRTPGFRGWQQEYWMYHCADAAAYIGRVGYQELRAAPEALEMVLHENDQYNWSPEQSQDYVECLAPDGDATGYLFRCLHCGTHLAYTDMG
jgi:uncharacterized protein CbrC (UPF0167 family)